MASYRTNDPLFTYVWPHLSELLLENVLKGQYVDLGEEIQTQTVRYQGGNYTNQKY